jgi:hypothetical protein
MGMEPFVAADDNAFGHLIASIPDPIKNLREALTFKAISCAKRKSRKSARS